MCKYINVSKKYIKIVDDLGPNAVYESFKSDWKWIKIRFPFSKKHIMRIDKLRYQIGYKQYYHVKGSHEHYFRLDKDNVYQIVECFKNFEIDDTVLTIYKEQKIIPAWIRSRRGFFLFYLPCLHQFVLKL